MPYRLLHIIQNLITSTTAAAAAILRHSRPPSRHVRAANRYPFPKNTLIHSHTMASEAEAGESSLAAQNCAPASTSPPVADAAPSDTSTVVATITSTTDEASEPPQLSKNQQKKLRRKQQFEATREAWKAAKKEKEKARKQRKREAAAAENALKRKMSSEDGQEVDSQSEAKRVKTRPVVEDITLLIDCGFDDLMTDKEVVSMGAQLTRCYSANRGSSRQFKMHVSSLNKRLLARYEGVLDNQHKKWKGMTFSSEPYPVTTDEEKARLVYLTADSPNTIPSLDPGKTYIIGGIVDRNRYKNLCFDKAQEQGIAHAKLPIGEYIKMASRQVLTTNQVVEIMLEWLQEKDWQKAFIKVIPRRKMPQLKKNEQGDNVGLEARDQDHEDFDEEMAVNEELENGG
ncbi:tRNA m(1)G methyltransferase domain-containing protein [Sphaerosporella brunnea]|uniref:tRNA (guanine(9)-N1)-methyltransferase n=1 Tax=Sphaerosporella brunnea TaxID=1250544 RepID=A0A5J5ES12_9PEZI|nr:tRNA m(1)G methyltransferase domain-containing protein [Sphaerosporella brunnea]